MLHEMNEPNKKMKITQQKAAFEMRVSFPNEIWTLRSLYHFNLANGKVIERKLVNASEY